MDLDRSAVDAGSSYLRTVLGESEEGSSNVYRPCQHGMKAQYCAHCLQQARELKEFVIRTNMAVHNTSKDLITRVERLEGQLRGLEIVIENLQDAIMELRPQ